MKNGLKIALAGLVLAGSLAGASAVQADPYWRHHGRDHWRHHHHIVCTWRHHHRVCWRR